MKDSQEFDGIFRSLANIEEALPDPLRKASARRRYLAHAAHLRRRPRPGPFLSALLAGFRTVLTVSLVLLLLFSGVLTGTAYAANAAIPGDALYSLDLQVEEIHLGLVRDPGQAIDLSLSFAGERLREIKQLISVGRQESIPLALDLYKNIISGPVLAKAKADASLVAASKQIAATLEIHARELDSLRGQVLPAQQVGFDQALTAVDSELHQHIDLDAPLRPGGGEEGPWFDDAPEGLEPSDVESDLGTGEAGAGEDASTPAGQEDAAEADPSNDRVTTPPGISNPGQDDSPPPGLSNPGKGDPTPPEKEKEKDKDK